MRRLITILLTAALALSMFAVGAQSASAGTPGDYSNSAYDLTQATTWDSSSGHCSDPCHIPYVGFTSHYSTTLVTRQGMMHYWSPMTTGQYIFSPALTPQLGQAVGVICWTTSTNLGVVDKIDARFDFTTDGHISPSITGSHLWIGYEDDDAVSLSYADRVNYVPHC